jgi:hypothetical protein
MLISTIERGFGLSSHEEVEQKMSFYKTDCQVTTPPVNR